jgi:hypothetical protein
LINRGDHLLHGLVAAIDLLLQHLQHNIVDVFRKIGSQATGNRRRIAQDFGEHIRHAAFKW